MLSRNCDGCPHQRECKKRFINARKGDFVYCPDGSRNLVDVNEEWLYE